MFFQTLAAILFILTTIGVAISVISAMWRTGATAVERRNRFVAAALLLAWLGGTVVLAATGAFADFTMFPPRIAPVLIAGNVIAIALVCSTVGQRLALETPLAWLVGIHVFRVGVELCLALLFHAQVVPVQMTFEGRNWDVLVGLTSIPMAWLAAHGRLRRGWLLAWTLAGLALLLNIVVISVLSMPTPFRAFPADPANTIIAAAPYVWLPAFLVPVALGAHLLMLRRLLLSRTSQPAQALASQAGPRGGR